MDYSYTDPLVSPGCVSSWLDSLARPIAVTGGTGFVGSHLVETLCAAGFEPRVLVRDPAKPRWIAGAPVNWIEGSLDTPESLKVLVQGAGTVIHLAGVVRAPNAAEFDRGNTTGTRNLLDVLAECAPNSQLIHVSSLAAAGPSVEVSGIGPEVEPAPISNYGRSKLGAEALVRECGKGINWSIVRPPAIYGPRDTDIFEFFRMTDFGVVPLPDGERWLTVAWVGDVVRSIISAAAASRQEYVYHLGEPNPILLDDLVGVLAEAGGKRVRILHLPVGLVVGIGTLGNVLQRLGWRRLALTRDKTRELLARHWTSRTEDSLAALGVSGFTPFAEGARISWAWYREKGWLA